MGKGPQNGLTAYGKMFTITHSQRETNQKSQSDSTSCLLEWPLPKRQKKNELAKI
jgi:hypothetical protein